MFTVIIARERVQIEFIRESGKSDWLDLLGATALLIAGPFKIALAYLPEKAGKSSHLLND